MKNKETLIIRLTARFASIILLLLGLALAQQPAAASEPADGASPTGSTDFNVADRLAITNLFGAMIYGLDEKRLDLLVGTVAPEFVAEFNILDNPTITVTGRDAFEKMMAARFENFRRMGIHRRHITSTPYFIEQTSTTAHVFIHILNCSMTNRENWRPVDSALGEFKLAKRNGVWAFTHQIESVDSSMDISLNDVLPVGAVVK
ncbi:nuclear transport factor 2 family protein [Propionivibrio sp.]|uniref:nuclear transport factor 2 family protein n=1 Tax=Propionivibrio sp. TaxID=2212460 RepID=UPI003BF0E857